MQGINGSGIVVAVVDNGMTAMRCRHKAVRLPLISALVLLVPRFDGDHCIFLVASAIPCVLFFRC